MLNARRRVFPSKLADVSLHYCAKGIRQACLSPRRIRRGDAKTLRLSEYAPRSIKLGRFTQNEYHPNGQMAQLELNRTVYSVIDMITWMKSGVLKLNPRFQRRAVWKAAAKSKLIDTIVLGLPMPIVILRELPPDLRLQFPSRKEVVDGQQRLRTIASFVDRNSLSDFDPARDDFTVRKSHNLSIAEKKYSELNLEVQNRILHYQISAHVFSSTVGDEQILDVFARLNSTGTRLNAQELRNAEYSGDFKSLMYELATQQLSRWRKWALFSDDDIARMQEVELASDLSNLILNGISAKAQKAIDDLYQKYEDKFANGAQLQQRFQNVMDGIEDHFGDKIDELGLNRTATFYALFAAVYDEMYGLKSSLAKAKPQKLSSNATARIGRASLRIKNQQAPANVLDALRGRTGHKGPREIVIRYLQK